MKANFKYYFIKAFLLLIILNTVSGVTAQKVARASFESINKKIIFPAVLKQLNKEDKFMFEYPTHLTYYNSSASIINELFGVSTAIGINARYNDAKADYIFEIQMNGIENITSMPVRWHSDNYGGPRGIVKDITYNFPCILIIKNRAGRVLKKLEIFGRNQEFKVTYQAGFLAGTFIPFGAAASADTAYERQHDEIHKKIEAQIAVNGYGIICQALVYFFNEYNTAKMSYSVAGVKMKNRDFDYGELDSANAHFKNSLNSYFDVDPSSAKQLFAANLLEYKKILDSNKPGVDNNVKDMVHFNMSWCYMFLNDFTAAWDNYNAATMAGIDTGGYYKREQRDRIGLYQFRNAVENAQSF